MTALELDQIQSNQLPNLFLVYFTWLSRILLLCPVSYNAHERLFSISALLWTIALEFDRIKSNELGNLFRINATWLSWIVLLPSFLYTLPEILFPIKTLFLMIALEFDRIKSNELGNVFSDKCYLIKLNSNTLAYIIHCPWNIIFNQCIVLDDSARIWPNK